MERLPGLGRRELRQRDKVGLIGCPPVKARMRPPAVVERQISADRGAGPGDAVVGFRYTSSYLTDRQSRSTKTLSRQAPLPSMLITISFLSSTLVKS